MTKLTTEDAIIEQLATGNKLRKLHKNITIDLTRKTKTEEVEGTFASINIPDGTDKDAYKEAESWYRQYIGGYTTITVIGRHGQIATVPYGAKNRLDDIIRIFNT